MKEGYNFFLILHRAPKTSLYIQLTCDNSGHEQTEKGGKRGHLDNSTFKLKTLNARPVRHTHSQQSNLELVHN